LAEQPADLRQRLSRIRLLVLDVDGVLTRGALYYGDDGEAMKAFHVHDGLGLRLLMDSGIQVGVITAKRGGALARRMKDLRIQHFLDGRSDKAAAMDELLTTAGVAPEATAYVGDDILDLPAMRRVGTAIAVRDAHSMVRHEAHWVTVAVGGGGAVREIADAVLSSQGKLHDAVARVTGAKIDELLEFRAVIPSRYASTRLPGKPLREIAGKPMIEHVWDRAVASGAVEVMVATDDERIAEAVRGFAGRVQMTDEAHTSGTDRIAEVASAHGWADESIVVNVQGDEPGIEPELIAMVARALAENPGAGIATLATPIREVAELFDPNVVKVVVDDSGLATYFSRAPIPYARDAFADGQPDQLPREITYLRHLGLYAYRVGVLRRVAMAGPRPAERAESLEQLRALAMGVAIHISIVDRAPLPGVDTEADLARVEAALSAD
jgi:3-deoxy-manno-octulosonate cytidylyltransferase (CMP-KDO synthetase)